MYVVARISVHLPIAVREVDPFHAHFKVERARAARVHIVNIQNADFLFPVHRVRLHADDVTYAGSASRISPSSCMLAFESGIRS